MASPVTTPQSDTSESERIALALALMKPQGAAMSKRQPDDHVFGDAELLYWLLKLPAIKAQAYFWNHSSRSERKKAMKKDMDEDNRHE